jgi:hypothetical protein
MYIRTNPAEGASWGGMEGYLTPASGSVSYSGVSGNESLSRAEKQRMIKEWIDDGRVYWN